MIHPHTRIQYINDAIGYGIFATQKIPKGAMVYVKDSLDIEIQEEEYKKYSQDMQERIEKYSYMDERGVRILCWDFAKFVNHCCNSNSLSSGYGFDIAIRDIKKGEEITCDYGMLNVEHDMQLICNQPDCRGILSSSDVETLFVDWDEKLKMALTLFPKVEQPLIPFLEDEIIEDLLSYLNDPRKYKSVLNLIVNPKKITSPILNP